MTNLILVVWHRLSPLASRRFDRASAPGVGGATPKGFEVAGSIHHRGLAFGAMVRVSIKDLVEHFGYEKI